MEALGRWCCVAALLVGCSFETTDAGGAGGLPAGASSTGSENGEASGQPTSGMPTSDPATTDPDSSPDPSDTVDPTSDPGSTSDNPPGSTSGGIDVDIGCPEPLPDGWVLCEDFEDIPDPAAHFSEWQGSGVGVEGPGRNSQNALSITHFANQNWSGVARMRFGVGPEAVNVANPEGEFEELWVRFYSRIHEGWPTGGPGDVLTIDGVSANPANATAFLARITADQFEPYMRSSAFTCVFGSNLLCDGFNDWDFLDFLGADIGETPLFTEEAAGEWTCVVLHARLNTPGQSDGALEVLVGDNLDSRVEGVDFRSNRGDFRFNRISLPTFMENAQSVDAHRSIDDVVVSTVSLDCD